MSKDLRLTTNIILSEAGSDPALANIRDIQVLKVGVFFDPRYDKFPITLKMLSEMIANFKKGVRGVVPALDYAHETDGPAAGWFKELFIKGEAGKEELWAKVEYTPGGLKSLADKEYAYISSDYDESYVDNETGEKFGCVFKGAALTNRPVIKKMAPAIQLSEETKPSEKGDCMDDKMLGDYKKLAEDMGAKTPEELMKIISDLKAEIAALKSAPAPKEDAMKLGEVEKQLSEKSTKLTESEKKIADLESKLKVSEKETEFTKMLSEGKAVPAQKEAFLKGDVAAFAAAAQPMKVTPAGTSTEPEAEGDADDQVLKLAKTLSEEKKIPMNEAIVEVLKTNKKLSEQRQAKGKAE